MPLKLAKNFVRRRSSGNVLETIENPPGQEPQVSSFRVLDRRNTEEGTVEGNGKLKRMSVIRPRYPPYQKRSTDLIERNAAGSNRGSEGTYNSGSIEREDDTSGSARYSYGSTTPSSVDYDSPNDEGVEQLQPPQIRSTQVASPSQEQPKSSSSFSIKSVGKTFSLTSSRKKANLAAITTPQSSEYSRQPRERSVTQSSYASTATPPKLELSPELGWVDAEFGNGLGDLLNRLDGNPNAIMEESEYEQTPRIESRPNMKFGSNFSQNVPENSFTPVQSRLNHFHPIDSSPFSMASANSQDRLISPPPVPRHGTNFGRSSSPGASSIQPRDTESSLVRGGVTNTGFQSGWPPRTLSREGMKQSSSQWDATSKATKSAIDEDESLFDSPSGKRKPIPQAKQVSEDKINRAMTQAEFEHYRSMAGKDEEEDEEAYDDDDDAERLRQAAKQRRKQEAHLAVYRQQMKKVTGELPSNLPDATSKPYLDHRATQSTSNLLSSGSTGKDWFEANTAKAGDDDDDDDIPLGVLQAHGFPSKSRPPSRINSSRSHSNLRSVSQMSTYPPPQGATRNDAGAGGGGIVPVFARKLPADLDPYVGVNLVNPANRSSMALNAGQPNLPAGGLVGIIDAEQRDRLTRRGSPNVQGNYGPVSTPMPGHMPPQMAAPMSRTMSMGNMQSLMQNGLPYGMPPQPISASEQAQVQMSNSFNQLMQMQMAMMQQMMGMQNMTPQQQQLLQMQQQQLNMMQQTQPQSQYLPPLQDPRASIMSDTGSQYGGDYQRRMSMMSRPGFPQQPWGGSFGGGLNAPHTNAGYAPSIAPSERSNVGQPSRYRPVTSLGIPSANQMQGQHSRTSTMSAQTIQYSLSPVGQEQQGVTGFKPPSSLALHRVSEPLPNTKIRAVSRPKYGNITGGRGSDDEDDEAGWQEMKKKKEARRGRWRRKQKEPEETPEGAYYDYDGAASEL